MVEDHVFRQLLETAPDGVIIVNGDGRMVLVNAEVEHLFGYTARELIDRPVEVLVPSRLRAIHNQHRTSYLRDPRPRPMGAGLTLMARRKDGSEFPVEISLSHVEAGGVVAAIVRDVSERRRAEDTMRAQAELLEFAHDAIIVLDMQRRIQYWNSGAERTYGWTAEEALGQRVDELLDTRMNEASVEASVDEMVLQLTRESLWEGELEHRAQDGRRIVVASRQTLRRGADGVAISALEINRDITARKLLERERASAGLEAERRQERDRIAMDLHDGVIQAIYAVGLNLEAISNDVEPVAADASAEIDDSIERLHAVINDIRSYIFQLRRGDLTGDVGAAVYALAKNVERSGAIAVTTAIGETPELREAAALALYHIAQEAMTNVLRHARANRVQVSLEAGGESVRLTIEDDGVGFDGSAEHGPDHHGMRNMTARARAVGGELMLESTPGAGSRLVLIVPV